jgi:hypothetical protein
LVMNIFIAIHQLPKMIKRINLIRNSILTN